METLDTVPAMYSTHVHDPFFFPKLHLAEGPCLYGIITIGIGCSFNCSGYDV